MESTIEATAPVPGDRRARRRQETIEEILAIADAVMTEEGVNGLSLSEVARRLGVKPPSIYKYFDSLRSIYDALFRTGPVGPTSRPCAPSMAQSDPGLDALAAGLEASGIWALAHPATAQLLFWRPVPSFEPTPVAMAPSVEMVRLQRQALADAAAAGQLGPGADSDEASLVTSRSSSAASSARRWPTSPASLGARAASAHCSPSFSARSPPSTLRSPSVAPGREAPTPRQVAAAVDRNDGLGVVRSNSPTPQRILRSHCGSTCRAPVVPISVSRFPQVRRVKTGWYRHGAALDSERSGGQVLDRLVSSFVIFGTRDQTSRSVPQLSVGVFNQVK